MLECKSPDKPFAIICTSILGGLYLGAPPIIPLVIFLRVYCGFDKGSNDLINAAIIAYIPSAMMMIWLTAKFIKKTNDKLCWKLTDDQLIGRSNGSLVIDLTSIASVIPYLPQDSKISKMIQKFGAVSLSAYGYKGPSIEQHNSWCRSNSLYLILDSGERLPICLHSIEGGTEIMIQLWEKVKDKVNEKYSYSAEEVKSIRRNGINKIHKGM